MHRFRRFLTLLMKTLERSHLTFKAASVSQSDIHFVPPSTHYCWLHWGSVECQFHTELFTLQWKSNPRSLDSEASVRPSRP